MKRVEKEINAYAIIDGEEYFNVDIGVHCHMHKPGTSEERKNLSRKLIVSKDGVFKRINKGSREGTNLNGEKFKFLDVKVGDSQFSVCKPWKRLQRPRIIACTFLEFFGDEWCDVHHINGNHLDNRLENLAFLNKRCHSKVTASDRQVKSIKNQTSINKEVGLGLSEMLELLTNDSSPIIRRHYSSPTEKLSHIKSVYMEKRQSFDTFVKINK